MSARVICADVMAGLAGLADESVQCAVTSPPYWGLRDYGVAGQIGLEPTPGEYIDRLVAVFRDVLRVLRSDAVCQRESELTRDVLEAYGVRRREP